MFQKCNIVRILETLLLCPITDVSETWHIPNVKCFRIMTCKIWKVSHTWRSKRMNCESLFANTSYPAQRNGYYCLLDYKLSFQLRSTYRSVFNLGRFIICLTPFWQLFIKCLVISYHAYPICNEICVKLHKVVTKLGKCIRIAHFCIINIYK